MTDYQNKIIDKVSEIFNQAAKEDDWKQCHELIQEMLLMEVSKSFRNGVRWARQK